MREYKRLNRKHATKLNRCKKIGSKVSGLVKWLSLLSLMVVLTGGAIMSFYLFIDGKDKKDISVKSSGYTDSTNNSNDSSDYDDKEVKLEGEITENNKPVNEESESNDSNVEKKKYDFSEWNKSCNREMIVVNKDNPISEALNVRTKICRGKEVGIDVCENLDKMIYDAKQDGIILWISSGYRSIELQAKLFNRQIEREKNKGVSEEEAEKRAQRVVAKPGTSEHNTGLAIDFNGVEDSFYETKEYEWLTEHAAEYGFIERYPKECEHITGVIYEPWHFRYVGVENATKIKESGLCLEEYVQKIQMNQE